jgi:hypothetical protein
MPKVGNTHYPYTAQGQAQAALARKRKPPTTQRGLGTVMRHAGGHGPGSGGGNVGGDGEGYYNPPSGGGFSRPVPKNPFKKKKKNPNDGGSDR